MTGKVLDSGASGVLILLLPIALIMVVLITAWPAILALVAIIIGWRIWQNYQWKKWCKQVDPFFYKLIRENKGCLTPMDLSLKANLTGKAAKRFLDKKAEDYGAQSKEEDKGTVYYFLTARALGSIFDESEPLSEDEESESDVSQITSASSAVAEIPQKSSASDIAQLVTPPESEIASSEKELAEKVSNPDQAEAKAEDTSTTEISSEQDTAISSESETESEAEETATAFPHSEVSNDQESEFALIQAELAKRLDLHSSTVGKRKSDEDFPQWSQSKDPEGIAWQYVPETKMFVPLDEDIEAETS